MKWYMPDGLLYYLSFRGSTADNNLIVDVNGDNPPNIIGKDMFVFRVNHADGTIVFNDDDGVLFSIFDDKNCGSAASNGLSCAKRIIDNGWVMDY
jgi:hypothetical protein